MDCYVVTVNLYFCHYELSLFFTVNTTLLKSILSDMCIVTPAFLGLLFSRYIFLHSFAFSLSIFLYFKMRLFCRQHVVSPAFLFFNPVLWSLSFNYLTSEHLMHFFFVYLHLGLSFYCLFSIFPTCFLFIFAFFSAFCKWYSTSLTYHSLLSAAI